MALDTLRLLILGSPGVGKTTLLWRTLLRSPMRGLVVDPEDELGSDQRDESIRLPSRYLRTGTRSVSEIVKLAARQDFPNLLAIDELQKYMTAHDRPSTNILLELLDEARNLALSWVGATKQPTLLPAYVTTLASDILINPPRTPAIQSWLREAGLDVDPARRLGRGVWVHVPAGGEPSEVTSDGALGFIEKALDLAAGSLATPAKPRRSRVRDVVRKWLAVLKIA